MQQLVEFTKIDNKLKITLLPEGKQQIKDYELMKRGIDSAFMQLIEYQLCNGWEIVDPEQVSALTNAILLSDNQYLSNKGEIESIESFYYYPGYAVLSEVEQLYTKGFIILDKCEVHK